MPAELNACCNRKAVASRSSSRLTITKTPFGLGRENSAGSTGGGPHPVFVNAPESSKTYSSASASPSTGAMFTCPGLNPSANADCRARASLAAWDFSSRRGCIRTYNSAVSFSARAARSLARPALSFASPACFSKAAWIWLDAVVARCPKWDSPQTPAAISRLATPAKIIWHQVTQGSKRSKMKMTAISPIRPINTRNAAHSAQLVLVENTSLSAAIPPESIEGDSYENQRLWRAAILFVCCVYPADCLTRA